MAQLVTRSETAYGDLSWLMQHWRTPIQRIFWINQVPGTHQRGGHRHVEGHMALHCLVGSLSVYVQTPQQDYHYRLNAASQYLLLDPQDWRLMNQFSPDAILMVIAELSFALTSYIDQPYRPVP